MRLGHGQRGQGPCHSRGRGIHRGTRHVVPRVRHGNDATSTSAPWTARVVVPVSDAPAALSRLERPSPSQLLEEIVEPVVADMETMNTNLRHIVGDRHPMLMAAADQIFGAGGKKLRPMIVLLMARATAEMGGLRWGRGGARRARHWPAPPTAGARARCCFRRSTQLSLRRGAPRPMPRPPQPPATIHSPQGHCCVPAAAG